LGASDNLDDLRQQTDPLANLVILHTPRSLEESTDFVVNPSSMNAVSS
jgi:hypothetical protein